MQTWLIVGYVVCFVALVSGAVMAVFGPGDLVRNLAIVAGGLTGMAILRCLEEVARRLPPPKR